MNTRVKEPNAISKNAVSVRVLIARLSMDHRQRAPAATATATASADAARVESSKVRSLLDINKTLAKENTFLSQQFDVLSKEAASLSHLLRSRHVLNAARELELKSALETSKHALREKEETVRRLEGRIDELEAHLKFAEELVVRAATDGAKTRREEIEMAVAMEKRKEKGKEMGNGENTPGTGATAKSAKSAKSARTTDVAYLEANHPWLSPVLLRLERLSNDSENEFRVPSSKRFSPSNEDRALAAADVGGVDLTLSGGEDSIDAGSGAYGISDAKGGDIHGSDGSDDSDEGGERGDRFETPEPVRCRLSVVDQPGSSVLKTPVTAPRSSLRRRNTVNYALPSLNAKLRQGDAHTFGSVERPAATPRNRKR